MPLKSTSLNACVVKGRGENILLWGLGKLRTFTEWYCFWKPKAGQNFNGLGGVIEGLGIPKRKGFLVEDTACIKTERKESTQSRTESMRLRYIWKINLAENKYQDILLKVIHVRVNNLFIILKYQINWAS